MEQENAANLPLLGGYEAVLMEHITANLHDPDNDLYLNPQPPVTRNEAEALLGRLPNFPPLPMDYQTIRTLGAASGADAKRRTHTEDAPPEARQQAAHLLTCVQRPFSMCYLCDETGRVDFRMGFPNDPDGSFVNSLLSSSFGFADWTAARKPRRRAYVWRAVCVPVQCNADELDRRDAPCAPGRWADAAAAATIGADCTLEVSFSPLDAGWARSQIAECLEADSKLSGYLKRRPQVSVNSAQTNVSSENANKILSLLQKKSVNISTNAAMSLSLSEDYAVYDTAMEFYEARLRHRIRLLQQASVGGWMVRMEVSASREDDPDAEILRSALGAALLPLGFACTWTRASAQTRTLASVILPSYLLPALVSFPTRPFVGLSLRSRSQLELNPPYDADTEPDSIPIGAILWNGADTGQILRIPRREMNRHAIVFGMTGGGKSNTVRSMLSELKDLRYMVIEPVKGEYHALPGIRRFTMVAGSPDSLSLNPFWFPPAARLQYHIDSLKLIISSAFDLYAAMPNILEQCLYRVYSNCGWNIVSGENIYRDELPEEDLFPTFDMLCEEVERYLNESAFEGETAGNYRGALLSRLQSFTSGSKGLLLNASSHVDFDAWLQENVVVELDALADDADKAIVMGALLVQYFQFIKYQPNGAQSNALRHLTVLEEAHHLFRETQPQSENGSSASGQLVSMLNNLLAEIRAYGEGFIIVDQSPSSISASVLKNTAVKIVHRVDYGEDIRLLQSALLLEDEDYVTASLAQGEALVRFGVMQSPAAVRIPPYAPKESPSHTDRPAEIDPVGAINDRIRNNALLLEYLYGNAERFVNLLLFETERQVIQEAFSLFQSSTEQWISYCFGWDYSSALTSQTFMDLLNLCVSHATAEAFPGQYCLQRMIRMFILRVGLLSAGELTEKNWDALKDYRYIRIYDRLSFYYQNHRDAGIRMMTDTLTPLPETAALKKIADALWRIPQDDTRQVEEAFENASRSLFYMPPSENIRARFKLLALKYCEKWRNSKAESI